MTRMTRGTMLRLAVPCALALAMCAAPTPRLSAGLDLYSLHMALSLGGPPVHLRTDASESGQSHDISLTIDIGSSR